MRHEATHAIQKCNNDKTVESVEVLENKLHKAKIKALKFSTSRFGGSYAKELEAYILEDKPRIVKQLIKTYCL